MSGKQNRKLLPLNDLFLLPLEHKGLCLLQRPFPILVQGVPLLQREKLFSLILKGLIIEFGLLDEW